MTEPETFPGQVIRRPIVTIESPLLTNPGARSYPLVTDHTEWRRSENGEHVKE